MSRTLQIRLLLLPVALAVTTVLRSAEPSAQTTSIGSSRPAPAGANDTLLADVRSIFERRCFKCHGQGSVAESGVFILDYRKLVASGDVEPRKKSFNVLEQLELGDMPKYDPERPDNKLSAAELATVRQWVAAGAPDYTIKATVIERTFLTDAALQQEIRADLANLEPQDRVFQRYYSLAHLYNAGPELVSDDVLDGYRLALGKLLNSLSWKRDIITPQAINRSKTLLR